MVKAVIIDPTKVVYMVLQNAGRHGRNVLIIRETAPPGAAEGKITKGAPAFAGAPFVIRVRDGKN
jgi:hypothetical protein